mmetsp:Transcript_270/g.978  ORF Transcript_270/g.978 Transcript_270/m.978 type:complete len:201 (+) Transcript_270:1023-1625(+)
MPPRSRAATRARWWSSEPLGRFGRRQATRCASAPQRVSSPRRRSHAKRAATMAEAACTSASGPARFDSSARSCGSRYAPAAQRTRSKLNSHDVGESAAGSSAPRRAAVPTKTGTTASASCAATERAATSVRHFPRSASAFAFVDCANNASAAAAAAASRAPPATGWTNDRAAALRPPALRPVGAGAGSSSTASWLWRSPV